MMRSTLLLLLMTATVSQAAEGALLDSTDEMRFTSPKEKASAELVEGKVGKAVRFRFEKDARSQFFLSKIRGTAAWDQAAGFSFWVRGNGPSDQFAGLQCIYDNDYAVRYDLCFPVKAGAWTKVTVAWEDLIPVLPGPRSLPLSVPDQPPSKISALWIGKWWYWGDYPALDFTIDEIRLEPSIPQPKLAPVPTGDPLARVKAKLRKGEPIRIVTMGDSLTDPRHHANRKTNWPTLLTEKLKGATVTNPAIGGTQLRQNLVLMPRWLAETPRPDLVTVWFGGNDWESGMRGPEFERSCIEAVRRIRQATGAEVVLMTTAPSADAHRTEPLAVAVRSAAKAENAALLEIAADWVALPKAEREGLFISDKVHLSPAGHQRVMTALTALFRPTE